MSIEAIINSQRGRFEAHVQDEIAVADYKLDDNTMTFTHTWVPQKLRGGGIGHELIKQALEYARDHHHNVVAKCPFVKSYLQEHPEFSSLTQ